MIQGTGAVRAGMWARSACVDDSLEIGSMLPQIEWAVSNSIPVLVMNPNENSSTMSEHSCFVWENYISKSRFKNLFVIAHSAGGACIMSIQESFPESFFSQVSKIAFTDSWVIQKDKLFNKNHQKWYQNNAVHYIASND